MMNLGRCIAVLLRKYPEVEVPGIGVFKKSYRPAAFDEEKQAFMPPASQVELIQGSTGGFLITEYLQAQRQMDKSEAVVFLAEAVDNLWAAARRMGSVKLDALGYLIAEEDSLVFDPFDTDTIRLKPVEGLPLVRVAEDEGMNAALIEDEEASVDEPRKRRIGLWVAAVLAILIGATATAWYVKPEWFNQLRSSHSLLGRGKDLPQNKAGVIPTPQTDTPKAVVVPTDTDRRDSSLVAGPSTDTVSTQSATVSIKPSVTYEIIVGSFATMKQAGKYVDDMRAKGYNLRAINSKMPGNRKKISWGSYTTEEEAYQELVKVQRDFEATAWVARLDHE